MTTLICLLVIAFMITVVGLALVGFYLIIRTVMRTIDEYQTNKEKVKENEQWKR